MERSTFVLLGRRTELYKTVANWRLPDVELYVNESPSEALAALADGQGLMLIFDTVGYKRIRHVIAKFMSLKGDADLILLGDQSMLDGAVAVPHEGMIRRLDPDIPADELRLVVERLLRLRSVRQRSGIVGRSRAVTEMISMIAQVAPLDVSVLIQGESGTGKELVARAIHTQSSRSSGPFLSLNCGAMSEGVLESELFGHQKGAFTGAVSRHQGVFQRADGGTLFLDEVGEMPLGMQTRFLRAIESGEFTPVGGSETLHSDIRLVAASHRDLTREVAEGRFRQDLYYRLRVVVIPAPPLRDRREDVPVLAEFFLGLENRKHGLSVRGFSRPALDLLQAASWPGNVRELRNMVSSVVILKQRGMIEADDLPAEIRTGGVSVGSSNLPVPLGHRRHEEIEIELLATTLLELREDIKDIKNMLSGRLIVQPDVAIPFGESLVETFGADSGYSTEPEGGGGDLQSAERFLIESALRSTGGKRRQAAQRLGISERTLYRKLNKYGLS